MQLVKRTLLGLVVLGLTRAFGTAQQVAQQLLKTPVA